MNTPDLFIETADTAVIPLTQDNEFDPISGYGVTTRDYAKQNPVVLEPTRGRLPDYSVSVYSTTNDPLYTQYQNNLVTPIAYVPNLDRGVLNKYLECAKGDGIYIVEQYTLAHLTRSSVPSLLEYYAQSRGISYHAPTIARIKEMVSSSITKKGRFIALTLRLLTYLPIDIIKKNTYTYVNGPGLVIVHGDVPDNLHHPYSPINLEGAVVDPVTDDGSVSIDISIIDNDNKPYYYMLGNDVKVVRPVHNKKNAVLPLGGSVTTKRGRAIVDEKFLPLEEFETHGFYRSKELCLYNGNKALAIEEAKHSIELKKVRLELEKLKEMNLKLILDKSTRESVSEMDIAKKQAELEHFSTVKDIELMHMGTKFEFENIAKIADIRTTNYKFGMDAVKLNNELYRAKELHKLKLTDFSTKVFDAVRKILK